MATYNVNTMQQFNDAIAGAGSGDVIEVNSDLDWNDVFDTQRTRVTLSGGDTINGLTINGNNHTIYNLTKGMITGINFGIFDFGASTNIKIDSLSFLNCAFGSTSEQIIYCYGSCTVKNAVIQGKFKGPIFRGSGMLITDSMITVSYSTGSPVFSGLGGQNVSYRYCWILLDNCIHNYNNVSYFSGLDGCYIEGKLGLVSAPDSPKVFANVNNCCINCTVNPLNEPVLSDFISVSSSSPFGQSPTIINITKIPALSDFSDTQYVKLVTDEQMKDAEYLASIGFDIIP